VQLCRTLSYRNRSSRARLQRLTQLPHRPRIRDVVEFEPYTHQSVKFVYRILIGHGYVMWWDLNRIRTKVSSSCIGLSRLQVLRLICTHVPSYCIPDAIYSNANTAARSTTAGSRGRVDQALPVPGQIHPNLTSTFELRKTLFFFFFFFKW
jgi:hypothetical protein